MLTNTTLTNISKKENIKVAIRVRPLLPNEQHRKEVIYYPINETGNLEVTYKYINASLIILTAFNFLMGIIDHKNRRWSSFD